MNPTEFPQSNSIFKKPEGWTDEQCLPLPTWRGNVPIDKEGNEIPQIISAWKPTPEELEEINRTGVVWLYITGDRMPPVSLSGHNPFEVSPE